MAQPIIENVNPTTAKTGAYVVVSGLYFVTDPDSGQSYTTQAVALNCTAEFGGVLKLRDSMTTNHSVWAQMPSVQELELCKSPDSSQYPDGYYTYQRNSLSLKLDIKIVRGNVDSTDTKTVLVTFDRPVLGQAGVYEGQLYFGKPPKYPGLVSGTAESLGGPNHGELRLYQDDPSSDINPLWNIVQSEVNLSQKTPTQLDANTTSLLRVIRERGTKVTPAPGDWHDDYLMADLPANFTSGYAVIWRDDIPSEAEYIPNDEERDLWEAEEEILRDEEREREAAEEEREEQQKEKQEAEDAEIDEESERIKHEKNGSNGSWS